MIWVFYFKEMAKRFTDTEKWEDEWFTDLSNDFKVIWFYLLDTCDNAGIWKKNIKKLNYLCNTNISTDDLLKVFGKRITILADEKWFINKFCVVQYGHDFLQSKNKAVLSAIKKLLIEGVQIDNIYSMNTLSIGYQYPTDTPKEQEQDKVNNKDNVEDIVLEEVKDEDKQISYSLAKKLLSDLCDWSLSFNMFEEALEEMNNIGFDKLCIIAQINENERVKIKECVSIRVEQQN
jgi:hypothetical protein